jgi:hypothetical protein
VQQFLDETRDTREYKRALAVTMAQQGIAYDTITAVLQVSKSFISKWKGIYTKQGVAGFRMGYRGSVGYLTADQRDQSIAWLREQNTWSLPLDVAHIDHIISGKHGTNDDGNLRVLCRRCHILRADRRHRQHQPVPRHPLRVGAPRALPLPLPADPFQRPKAQLNPHPQSIPALLHLPRRQVR